MVKVKIKIKNLIYSIGFLFRPIMTIAVSLVFLIVTGIVLIVIIKNMDKSLKMYEVLLSILTGITASLVIAIMMELYNNYRFNTKRQRELRKYFRNVASYEVHQRSIMKVNAEYESDDMLGDGRPYAVFWRLGKIIPVLRKVLSNRDYLYRIEIDEIDDILDKYGDIFQVIMAGLFGPYVKLISQEHDETVDEHITKYNKCTVEKEGTEDYELIYPELFNFLKTAAINYVENKHNPFSYDQNFEQFESIIEKAIFNNHHIFKGYFEVTEAWDEWVEEPGIGRITDKKGFEFRSNIISNACGDIDKSMIKLQKRLSIEPYIWTMVDYSRKD